MYKLPYYEERKFVNFLWLIPHKPIASDPQSLTNILGIMIEGLLSISGATMVWLLKVENSPEFFPFYEYALVNKVFWDFQ